MACLHRRTVNAALLPVGLSCSVARGPAAEVDALVGSFADRVSLASFEPEFQARQA